jgi:hypothetical protein
VGDLIKMNKDMMEGWDLTAVVIRGQQGMDEVMKTLNEGFEPYAVTHWMEAPPQMAIKVGSPQMPTIVEKLWFRRKQLVPVAEKPIKA